MADLTSALQAHATRFRRDRGSGLRADARAAGDEAIDRLIAWSAAHAAALVDRGPEGVEPAFGVVPAGGVASVWRVYPRQGDGGKVALLPMAEHYLTQGERATLVRELERLHPGRRIGAGQRLELGLPRLARDTVWAAFVPLLDLALATAAGAQNGGPAT